MLQWKWACFGMFLGRHLSVRKRPTVRPLMILDQDDSVFNQSLLKLRQWDGPQGQRPPLLKTDGLCLNMSAISIP